MSSDDLFKKNLEDSFLLTVKIINSNLLTKDEKCLLALMFANSLYLDSNEKEHPEIDSRYNELLNIIISMGE